MMIRFQLGLLIILTAVFAVLMICVRAISFDDDQDVLAFIQATENCGGTCLLGIQPGISTVGETMNILREHTWVQDVRQNAAGNGFAVISWTWSGEQPRLIDTSREGRITFYWDDEDPAKIGLDNTRIETITVYTHIRMYSLQYWLGETDNGDASLRPNGDLGYRVSYKITGGMINLITQMPCPANLFTYWNSHARITVSIGRGVNQYVNLMDMMKVCEQL